MGIVSHIVATTSGTDTSDATAVAWDIKAGKTAYLAAGETTGTAYTPAMMQFDGSTGTYSKADSVTSSGNKVTAILRFRRNTFSGGAAEYLLNYRGPNDYIRASILAISSDHATVSFRNTVQFRVQNSAGTIVLILASPASTYLDGEPHIIHAAFDGDAGTAIFRIDHADADDTGNAGRNGPEAATLNTGSGSDFYVGSLDGASLFTAAQIGFCGVRDAYLTNYTDFSQTDGSPKELDVTTWAEWSGGSVTSPLGRPLFFNPHGDMSDNLGSAGDMRHSGLNASPQSLSSIVVGNGGT